MPTYDLSRFDAVTLDWKDLAWGALPRLAPADCPIVVRLQVAGGPDGSRADTELLQVGGAVAGAVGEGKFLSSYDVTAVTVAELGAGAYVIDLVITVPEAQWVMTTLSAVADAAARGLATLAGWTGASIPKATLGAYSAKPFTLGTPDWVKQLAGFWLGRPVLYAWRNGKLGFGASFVLGVGGQPFGADGKSFARGLSDDLGSLVPVQGKLLIPMPGAGPGEGEGDQIGETSGTAKAVVALVFALVGYAIAKRFL